MVNKLFGTLIVCGLCLPGLAAADTAATSEISDADLTDRVVHQLATSERDIAGRVHVSTANGVVTVEATGLTTVQATKVLVEVHAVPGVTKVENHLHIRM